MDNWKQIYKERQTTAAEAVKLIKSGNRVSLAHSVGEPTHIIEAMIANRETYRTKKSAEVADVVIAQINRHMPRTLGDSFVHVSRMSAIVLHDAPLIELPPPRITEVEKAIGENCARLINDGDCLQLDNRFFDPDCPAGKEQHG